MSPKPSAKKRKAPETNQASLDSSYASHDGHSKLITLPKSQNTSTVSCRISAENENENVSMMIDKKKDAIRTATLLGRCRRHPLRAKIEVHQFQETRPEIPSDTQFDDTWTVLRGLVEAILNRQPVTSNFQVAYELCQSACLYGKENVLYNNLESALSTHIQQENDLIIRDLRERVFLATPERSWEIFCDHLGTIRNIFMELERRYIMPDTEYTSILDLGTQMFRKGVMESHQIQQKTIERIMGLIRLDRDDTLDDDDLKIIRSITQMFLDLSLYTPLLEPHFMKSTTEYYTVESSKKLQKLSIREYLHHAHHRIQQEREKRISTYLDESTKAPLTDLVVKIFIHDKLEIILSQGFEDLVDQEDTVTLGILYHSLLSHQKLLTAKLRGAFADYIKNHGLELIKDPAQDRTMIPTLLQYKAKLDRILEMAFENNSSFTNTFKESFENFINSRNSKPAEMLAKFIDSKLRSGTKKQLQQDENIEDLLDKVLVIFRYIQGKDVFEAFYRRFLSKRLLLSRSVSNDMEKNVLSKIKLECGSEFTKNLENMFKDMEISADLNVAFKESQEYAEQEDIPTFVNILAQGTWPAHPTADIVLPINMTSILDAYQLFYTKKFNGRKLTWRHALGTCTLKAHFPMAKKELSVGLFQATVLMLFNDKSKSTMGYKDIAHATELDGRELKRVLQSLSCGKYIILNKHPKNNIIADEDEFQYNDKFTASTYRLKINVIQQDKLVEEQKEIQTKMLMDRQYQLEAAIVRIMKSKKRMIHQDLVHELFEQLQFPIDGRDIKDRIEWLIDRDYLIRDETNSSLYIYQS